MAYSKGTGKPFNAYVRTRGENPARVGAVTVDSMTDDLMLYAKRAGASPSTENPRLSVNRKPAKNKATK